MKAVILEDLGVSEEMLQKAEQPLIEKGVSFTTYSRTNDASLLVKEAEGAEAVILANMPMPDSVIAQLHDLKFIDVAFTGVDHIGLNAAKTQHIAVSNASGYSREAVAEEAVGMAISLYRNLIEEDSRVRNGFAKSAPGKEIKGKTVGIIGLGSIGMRSAELFHAFGAEILSYNRTFHPNVPAYVKQTTLAELLKQSDIVLIHCPLNDASRGLIGKEQLKLMKRDAILLNLARGPIVNNQELAEALKQGMIAGAGIDVFDQEPPLDPDDPLLHAPHTILAPHIGFSTEEAMQIRLGIVMDNLSAWMDGHQKNIIL